MTGFIPYGRQLIEADDEAAVLSALRSDYLTQGPATAAFEKDIADFTGAKFCVAVSSATAGLHIAMAALALPSGEGITSPNTFVATANAMIYNGLDPVLADIEPDTFNLSPVAAEAAITDRTRLIAPVHFAGLPADMEAFAALAGDRGLTLIEDAAHAIGSDYASGGRVGNGRFSAMTVFSFHPVKSMTTGEGGAITTNDPALYERLMMLRSHGITRDPARLTDPPGTWWYEQQVLGFNYRMTDFQAALGTSQLRKLDRFAARRRAIIARYRTALSDLSWLALPHDAGDQRVCYHLFVARFDFDALGRTRAEVMAALAAEGVGSQVHYIPVYRQPWHTGLARDAMQQFPANEDYYARCLSLPLYPAMTDDDVEQVIAAVRGLA
ncbi:MAG: UDP-4-amino-4,6-dideoxy-N-acetyl-beta-L-altrosamine transaminase [Caulobacteraceae bacterium]|nr:UDP-4-amino-4,6-dideoxy-N-acetyl-beta-L-altrosamine transaminase [Caulobacteraceae bacterium]